MTIKAPRPDDEPFWTESQWREHFVESEYHLSCINRQSSTARKQLELFLDAMLIHWEDGGSGVYLEDIKDILKTSTEQAQKLGDQETISLIAKYEKKIYQILKK